MQDVLDCGLEGPSQPNNSIVSLHDVVALNKRCLCKCFQLHPYATPDATQDATQDARDKEKGGEAIGEQIVEASPPPLHHRH